MADRVATTARPAAATLARSEVRNVCARDGGNIDAGVHQDQSVERCRERQPQGVRLRRAQSLVCLSRTCMARAFRWRGPAYVLERVTAAASVLDAVQPRDGAVWWQPVRERGRRVRGEDVLDACGAGRR